MTTAIALLVSASAAIGQCTPQWRAMPANAWPEDEILCLKAWDSAPSGPVLLVGGNLQSAGTLQLNYVGAWSGTTWSAFGSGFSGSSESVALYDPDGSGPTPEQPVFGGIFASAGGLVVQNVALWNGGTWQPLGTGMTGPAIDSVFALLRVGSELFATGDFHNAGGLAADGAARWSGTQWQAFPDTGARWGYSLHSHKDDVYVGTPLGVRRWTGSAWVVPGPNAPTDETYALITWRGKLVAAGWFNSFCCGNPPPPQPGERIAIFDGNTWSSLGSGMNGYINALCSFDPDGVGPIPELLIAGGLFSTAGGVPASRIAAWDGNQWSPLGPGVNNEVNALAVFQNQLYVGGFFTTAGGLNSPYLAVWGCPQQPTPCYPNCDASITSPSLTANDFMCFLNKFANRDSYANCDGSTVTPTLSANDFQCFINKYAAGCP